MSDDSLNREFRKIKSLNFLYEINGDGTIFRNVKSKKHLKIKLDYHHSQSGYYVTFVHIGGRSKNARIIRVMIHRAVAECWLGDCPEGYEVDHINRDSHDNRYTNLRYVTHSEQMRNRDHTNIARRGKHNLEEARRQRMVGVSIIKNGETKTFKSQCACARFFDSQDILSYNRAIWRLNARRHHIKGFDIVYRNAETVHGRSKEQETVHAM